MTSWPVLPLAAAIAGPDIFAMPCSLIIDIRSAECKGRDGAFNAGDGGKTPGRARRYPLRAEPQWLAASRPCLFRNLRLRNRKGTGRAFPPAHRGHRHWPLPPRIRAGDL